MTRCLRTAARIGLTIAGFSGFLLALVAEDAPSSNQAKALIDTPAKAKAAQAQSAKKLGKPIQWTNTVSMDFQLIPPGEFIMGSIDGDADAPPHKVRLSQPFYLGTHEVTRQQFKDVTGQERSTYFPGPDQPINFISWYEAIDFLNALNKKENRDPKAGYRLPYEAEWEYAARAGSTTNFPTGNSAKDLTKVGWFVDNAEDTTHPVSQKQTNAFGLHDMNGNVWEWCTDYYDPQYYRYSPEVDPKGPSLTLSWYRVLRGGSVYYTAQACRSSNRAFYQDSRTERTIGFRIVLPISEAKPEKPTP